MQTASKPLAKSVLISGFWTQITERFEKSQIESLLPVRPPGRRTFQGVVERAKHRRDKIHKYGHMHLDDFIERADRFKNEVIIAGHFSTRYHPNEVRQLLGHRLPPELKDRMRLWI